MFDATTSYINWLADWLWAYPVIWFIIIGGVWLTVRSRLFQIRTFPAVCRTFAHYVRAPNENADGVSPLKAFFASLGGAIGIGNVIVICAAVQIGGPGAIFWAWVTAFLGMAIKYGEVFLGMVTRVKNDKGSYDGGPMYFLPKAFKVRWIAYAVAVLLCIYGAEIFIFAELTDIISYGWHINRGVVIAIILALVLIVGVGGVGRVGEISTAIIPVFVLIYLVLCLWVLFVHVDQIPAMFGMIFKSAFVGHAPVGAFAGAGWLVAVSQGAARGCYSGDIGIGYASVIHAESSTQQPERQASLAVFGIFLDTFVVCTLSVLVILVTGVWQEPIPVGLLVQTALALHFPHMGLFMPIFLFMLGYSTIIAYYAFGLKAAAFIGGTLGRWVFTLYAICAMIVFSFLNPAIALAVMTAAGGLLLLVNVGAIWILRRQIDFDIKWSYHPSKR